MATFTKRLLSQSTNGKSVMVSGTTLVHTAVAGTSDFDEVWIWAVNSASTVTKLTLEWGETTIPNGTIEVNIPGESGLLLVAPGLLLQNALEINAVASVDNTVLLHGFVNRITA